MSAVVNTFFQLVRQPAIATDQLFFHLLLQCEAQQIQGVPDPYHCPIKVFKHG